MTFNKQELIDYFKTTNSMVSTNFPKFAASKLKKGYLITRRGKGNDTIYEVKIVSPEDVDYSNFSTRKIEIAKDLPNEIWKTTFCSPKHEVSNLGRIRKRDSKILVPGTLKDGYLTSELITNKQFRIHRIVKQTFDPVENFETMVVDHINGIRTDNRLENLRWASSEENTLFMLKNREEITRETTRLIQKYGYNKTLELIRAIP